MEKNLSENSISETLVSSYRPKELDSQNCLICQKNGPFSLHLIEASFPEFGGGSGPFKRLGPFVPQAVSHGHISGGLAICTDCAPVCQKCGLPIRTRVVEKVYRLLSMKLPSGCSVSLGNGYCRHGNFSLRLFHRPKTYKFLNPFEMFEAIRAMNAIFSPAGLPPKVNVSETRKNSSPEYVVGDMILGRYLIERVLKGGMGTVFVVRNGDERIVLKTFFGDSRSRTLFETEARNWISLGNHPNIVQARWVDNIGSMLCVAANYIPPDGLNRTSLADHIRYGMINREQILRWSCEFCYGMEHAQSRGLYVHRDIKPDNILIDANGSLLLTDFGISLTRGEATQVRGAAGTFPYMPPEQWRGDTAGFATDVYAFGVVLFQLVFGKLPIEADTSEGWRLKHEAVKVIPAHPMSSIIQRALSSKPTERFSVPEELLAAVTNVATLMKVPLPPKPSVIDDQQNELLGLASLHAVGNYGNALHAAKKLTQLYPHFAPGWTQLGRLCLEKGKVEDAARASQESLRIDPTRSAPWNNLGLCFKRMGDFERTIKAFEAAIRWDPQNAGAMSNLARVLAERTSPDVAIQWGRRAVEIAPDNWIYWVNLGSVLRIAEQEKEARAAFERAIELAPQEAHAGIRSVLDNP